MRWRRERGRYIWRREGDIYGGDGEDREGDIYGGDEEIEKRESDIWRRWRDREEGEAKRSVEE